MKHRIIISVAILLCLGVQTSYSITKPQWLENAVIYQVYPSSYQDSDGNGIGDIPGVISRLDYIKSLGVSAIWFNPLFCSDWVDGGYDVTDYYRVDPRFGTNDDLVRLIEESHRRGLRVMLDLVPGHTSVNHPWFRGSASGTNLQHSDYFIWSDRLPDAKAERELQTMLKDPDYMQNTTGKWMKSDSPRGRFYMKNFYACQPSLNFGFANPDPDHPWEQSTDAPGPRAVLREMLNILAFWFDKGVDGFRVDMAKSLVKNDPDKVEIRKLWHKVRSWMDENYTDRVLMAEWNNATVSLEAGFNIDMDLNSIRFDCRKMYFDRQHQADGGSYFSLDGGTPSVKDLYGNPWPEECITRKETPSTMLADYYKHFTESYEAALAADACFATITGNHDHLRLNTGGRNSADQLKVMMAWVMTMPLPILYYGDEIGLRSLVELPNVEGANHNGKERAGARTPMQWDSSANAGFSTCAPENLYLPVCPEWTPATSWSKYMDWKEGGCKKPTSKGLITVESQEGDPSSLLNWTRSLIELRKSNAAFWASSSFEPIFNEENPYPMVYKRSCDAASYIIVLNPTAKTRKVVIPSQNAAGSTAAAVVMSSGKGSYKSSSRGDSISIGPTSSMIIKL